MKKLKSLACDYWIENTHRIYKENLHVSTPVIEAYQAGFEKAKQLCIEKLNTPLKKSNKYSHWLKDIGEDEE